MPEAGSAAATGESDAGARGGAVGLMLLAMFGFALQDMAVKLVAEELSLWQLQLLRSAIVLMILAAVGRLWLRRRLLPRGWGWPLARAAVMMMAYLLFYGSLPLLSLAQAGAAFYVGPLFITLFAALLLGEPIGPRRVVAVVAGFAGVLLIVRPGLEGWTPVALLPVLAAAFYATGVVLTRWRCGGESGIALSMTHNIVYSAVGLLGVLAMPLLPLGEGFRADWPFLASGWLPLGLGALAIVAVTAGTHVLGMLCSIEAYRREEASRIAPFEYSYLLVLPLLDLAIWGELPDAALLAGMALIIGSGGFVAWREGRPARPTIQPQGESPWTPDAAGGKEGPLTDASEGP